MGKVREGPTSCSFSTSSSFSCCHGGLFSKDKLHQVGYLVYQRDVTEGSLCSAKRVVTYSTAEEGDSPKATSKLVTKSN